MISIIIPTYRPGEYVFECLNSIKNQTLGFDLFEVIMVLNGDREPYEDELLDFIENEMNSCNISLICVEEEGVSNARNIGIDHSIGEYITFIDDDDYISPSYLADMYKIANKGVMPISYLKAFIDESEVLVANYITSTFDRHYKTYNPNIFQLRSYFSTSCCKLIDISIIGNRRFNTKYKNSEDSLFMALISDKIGNLEMTSKEAIYYRRIRENSASTRIKGPRENVVNNLRLVVEYIKIYFKNPFGYNFWFIMSRVFAAIQKLFR